MASCNLAAVVTEQTNPRKVRKRHPFYNNEGGKNENFRQTKRLKFTKLGTYTIQCKVISSCLHLSHSYNMQSQGRGFFHSFIPIFSGVHHKSIPCSRLGYANCQWHSRPRPLPPGGNRWSLEKTVHERL